MYMQVRYILYTNSIVYVCSNVYVTVYAKTYHMSAKIFLRFLTDIGKYRLMHLRCKFGVDCLLPARDIATFICAILKINIPKTAIIT